MPRRLKCKQTKKVNNPVGKHCGKKRNQRPNSGDKRTQAMNKC